MKRANTLEFKPGERIEKCATCGLPLPLRRPQPGERSTTWICTGCSAKYDAVLTERCSPQVIQHVRPAEFHFKTSKLVHPPRAIAKFVRKHLVPEAYHGSERRRSPRYPTVAMALAMPVSELLQPEGEAFMALVRNISTRGIAMVSTRAVTNKLLAVELGVGTDERMQLVAEVLRCRAVHRFYEIGGRFLTRVDGLSHSSSKRAEDGESQAADSKHASGAEAEQTAAPPTD